jgi:hypothetical protein
MIENIDAIRALVPDAEMVYSQGVVTQWLDERTQPTDEEIATKKTELQAEYDAKDWERNRQAEYPSLEDCIHALLDGGDTLTDLQAARQLVKDNNPKPSE